MGGPSMHGNARWGQVLNVEEAYLSSNQSFIRPLFSGVQGNGNAAGRAGGTVRWGHEHWASGGLRGSPQPLLVDLAAQTDGGWLDDGASPLPPCPSAPAPDGKLTGRSPRLTV